LRWLTRATFTAFGSSVSIVFPHPRVEYDATSLNAAAVTKLVREAGLEIAPDDNAEGEPIIAAPAPAAAAPPTA
jgi:hypothetical protein